MTTPTKPVSGEGAKLRRLLFTQNLNLFDGFYIGIATSFFATGHWVAAIAILIVCPRVSVSGERSLARSDEQWS